MTNTMIAKMVGAAYAGVVTMGMAACAAQKSIPATAQFHQNSKKHNKQRH